MRMPAFSRRAAAIWSVLALAAGAGGAAFATSSSSAEDPAVTSSGELRIAATTDPAFASSDPVAARAAANVEAATGVPAAVGLPRTWNVGGRTIIGYVAARGRFCFAFAGGAGGCMGPGALTDALPLNVTTDYGPGTFNLYGLALDGVTAVTVRLGGRSQPAAFAHNAFAFSDPRLGGSAAIEGEAIATMSDGTTRSVPFNTGPLEGEPVTLP